MALYRGIRTDDEVDIDQDIADWIEKRRLPDEMTPDVMRGFADAVLAYRACRSVFEDPERAKKKLLKGPARARFEGYVKTLRQLRDDIRDPQFGIQFTSRGHHLKRAREAVEGRERNSTQAGATPTALWPDEAAEVLAQTIEDLIRQRDIDPRRYERAAILAFIYDLRAMVHQYLKPSAGLEPLVELGMKAIGRHSERSARYYIEELDKGLALRRERERLRGELREKLQEIQDLEGGDERLKTEMLREALRLKEESIALSERDDDDWVQLLHQLI